jgi:hypothetical protein
MAIFTLRDYRNGNQERHGVHLVFWVGVKENSMAEKWIVITIFGLILEAISLDSSIA